MTRRRLRLTRVVSTLGLVGGLCLLAACQLPTAPTPTPPCVVVGSGSGTPTPVMVDIGHCGPANILHNQPGPVTAGGGAGGEGGSGTGGDGGTGGEGGEGTPTGDGRDNAPTGPASIIASGSNDDGAVIYQIGPGQVFTRTGGDAATVWCRPASDCNGEGGNRTAVNAASPPAAWIEDRQAVFRRSGTEGTTVTFTVDGVTLTHDFSTGG